MPADSLRSRTFILVEGITDIAFLSLYICRQYGFKYASKPGMKSQRFTVERYIKNKRKNDEVYTDELYICACDGHTNFATAYEESILPMLLELHPLARARLITIEDHDDSTIEESSDAKRIPLTFVDEKEFLDDGIPDDYVIGSFGTEVYYKALRVQIPNDQYGCLETIIMQSIEEQDPAIVTESTEFIDHLSKGASRYIAHRRKKIKAKMGTVFTLLNPDHTFDEIKQRFECVDCNSEAIQKQYGFLSILDKE